MTIRSILGNIYRKFHPIIDRGHDNNISVLSHLRNSSITIYDSHNTIKIGEGCIINNCVISIFGDNNTLIIEDKARLLGGARIIMEGNSIVRIGHNAGVRKVDFLAKGANIEIGELCMFSNNIIVRNHDSHRVLNFAGDQITNPPQNVVLGRHVWIGQNVTILKGVNIGDDSILAFGSVVTKSCPPNCIMAGNPARIVKSEVAWDY